MADSKLVQKGLLRHRVVPPLPPLAGPALAGDDLRELKRHLAALIAPDAVPPTADGSPLAARFAAVAAAVNGAKRPLDAIPTGEYSELSLALDLYHGLKQTARARFKLHPVTNATLKMYELLAAGPAAQRLIVCDASRGPIRVFCNAELPGAFLIAIEHYVRSACPAGAVLDWVASSYYPPAAQASGDETILQDAYGLYAQNPDRWLMGPPPRPSGDLTDAAVVARLARDAETRLGGKAALYTSDAGVDVSADYYGQEALTLALNFGQVLCGLLALAPGGHLVTKQYTFVSPFSRSLIGLLSLLFREVHITKPRTSRPANSEVYLVARDYRGLPDPELGALLLRVLDAMKPPERVTVGNPTGARVNEYSVLLPWVSEDSVLEAAEDLHKKKQVAFLEEIARLRAEWRGRVPELTRGLHPSARQLQEAYLQAVRLRRAEGTRPVFVNKKK